MCMYVLVYREGKTALNEGGVCWARGVEQAFPTHQSFVRHTRTATPPSPEVRINCSSYRPGSMLVNWYCAGELVSHWKQMRKGEALMTKTMPLCHQPASAVEHTLKFLVIMLKIPEFQLLNSQVKPSNLTSKFHS